MTKDRLRALAANTFIVAFLLTIFVDGVPSLGLFHDRAKVWIDWLVDVTGIWQGSWSVFTPTVDRENHHLEASIDYSDGSHAQWQSANWKDLSAARKMLRFREMEYFEQLHSTNNQAALPEFARFLADQLRPTDGAMPISVVVTYHSSSTPPPAEGDCQPKHASDDHPDVDILYEEAAE